MNGSIPQAICFAPQQRKEKFSIQFGEIDCQAGEMFTAAENNAKACNESLGDLGAYLNTPQTAADSTFGFPFFEFVGACIESFNIGKTIRMIPNNYCSLSQLLR